jgi:hypothetical protein
MPGRLVIFIICTALSKCCTIAGGSRKKQFPVRVYATAILFAGGRSSGGESGLAVQKKSIFQRLLYPADFAILCLNQLPAYELEKNTFRVDGHRNGFGIGCANAGRATAGYRSQAYD